MCFDVVPEFYTNQIHMFTQAPTGESLMILEIAIFMFILSNFLNVVRTSFPNSLLIS